MFLSLLIVIIPQSYNSLFSYSKELVQPNLFNRHGMWLTGRFVEGRITHYLKFSVKITTNQLHYHFKNKVPFLERKISEFALLR